MYIEPILELILDVLLDDGGLAHRLVPQEYYFVFGSTPADCA